MGVKMGKHNRCFVISLVAISLFFGFTAVVQAASSGPGREWLRTPITYSCVNEPIETVLLALADQAKVDIVKSPRVTGSVTVKLTDVPLEEALTNILAAHDFTFIATSRMIRVVPLPEVVAIREPLDTRIYQISFADANEIAVALAGFVSEQGKIALNKGTSHLVVTDVQSRIKVIDEFIRQIERPTPQILVEVQIYDITTNEGFELETNWSVGRNAPLKTTEHVNRRINTDFPTSLSETTTTVTGPSSSSFSEGTSGSSSTTENRNENSLSGQTTTGSSSTSSSRVENSTFEEDSTSGTTSSLSRNETTDSISETTGNYRDADDGFGSFTTTGSSAQNRTELSDSASSQNTTGFSTTDRLENSDTTSNEQVSGSTISQRTDSSSTTSGQETGGWTYDTGRTDTETTVTQLPVGTYYDTTTESFVTRRRKPFVGATFDAQTGGTLRFSLLNDAVDIELALRALSKEVESKLLANPRVLVLDNETADFEIVREIPYRELMQVERAAGITYTAFKDVGVRLKVTPHIAAGGMIKLHITPEFGILVGQNADGAPTVDTRRADTIAMIRDGQTVVIGGLRKRETIKAVSKVPVLGDMPLLGGLFKSQTESVQVNEMVVFITSRIVTEPTLSDTEQRQLRTSELSTKDLSKIEAEREMTEKILKSMSNK